MKSVAFASILFAAVGAFAADRKPSPAEKDNSGFWIHVVESEYQAGPTKIRVLLPDNLPKVNRSPVLYVLPVEPLDGVEWGDGLAEVRKNDLHNKHGLICVMPAFSAMPWFADHPTDAKVRQESYFLKDVVPLIDRTYPTLAKPEGRLLLGFSKSGWGAFSLLLRHPETFGKAAAWDAPLMTDRPNKWEMGSVFGTQENFSGYQISELLKKQAGQFHGPPKLIHFGYDIFRGDHQRAEELMNELKITRVYRDGPHRKHAWKSGWVPEAVEMLVARQGPEAVRDGKAGRTVTE